MGMLKDVWNYRDFILGSVKREFQLRYHNSLLGVLWNILNPLALIFVYTLVFSRVIHTKLPGADGTYAYSIYLCSGILTWSLFSEIVTKCQTMFIDQSNLLKKVSFPRICLPVVVVLNASINFLIIFSLFTLFLILSGNFPNWTYLGLFPLLIVEITFSVGLGVIIGVLNVFFRDIGQFTGIAMQFWFWLTPIVYSLESLPEFARPYFALNPMTSLMSSYQGIFVSHAFPPWKSLLFLGLLSTIVCCLAVILFKRHSVDMVDEL